ncbi:236_t:CDS:1, partial [Rhizophagus irregularis]
SEIIENQGENKYGLINIFIFINVDSTYQSLVDKVKPFIPKQIKECCEDFVELHNDINIDNEIEKEYKNNLYSHLFKEDTNHTI